MSMIPNECLLFRIVFIRKFVMFVKLSFYFAIQLKNIPNCAIDFVLR